MYYVYIDVYWRRKWQPTPVCLPGESRGQRSLVGCCTWHHTVEHDWSDLACTHALEKEMATHYSVLAWRIAGTEEPGGLPSVGLQSRTRLKRLSSSRCILTISLSVVLKPYQYLCHWACTLMLIFFSNTPLLCHTFVSHHTFVLISLAIE